MARKNMVDILTGDLGKSKKRRRAFSTKTKKLEWRLAGGHTDLNEPFPHASKCRRCKRKLKWKDGSYDFDHRDNNPTNISPGNCYLVCKICHGKVTKTAKRKYMDEFGIIRYKTIKKKIDYKKPKKHKIKSKRRKRVRSIGQFTFNISIPKIKI